MLFDSLSVLTAILPGGTGTRMFPFWIFLELKGGDDNWSCKTCKAPVKPTPNLLQAGMPFQVAQPTCQRTITSKDVNTFLNLKLIT